MAGKKDISAGRAFVELYVKGGLLEKGLRSASARLQSWGKSAAMAGGAMTAAGAAILAPIAAAASSFAATGDDLHKMAARTGASVEALSELGFAMEQSGSDSAMLEKGLFGLSRAYFDLERGGAASKDAFGAIGVSLDQLASRNPEQQLELIADGLAGVEDVAKRGAIAQQLLGRAGRQMLPMLADGAEGMRKMRQEARDLGLTKTDEQAQLAADVTDAINRVRKAMGAAVFEIGGALAPAILEGLEAFKTIAVAAGKWVKENKQLVITLAGIGAGLVAAGTAVTVVGMALVGMGLALSAIATIVGAIGGAIGFVLSPLGLLVGGFAAAVAAWARFTESGQATVAAIRETFGQMLETGREAVAGIADALMAGDLALAGEIAIAGLRLMVMQGLLALSDLVGGQWGDTVASVGNSLLNGDVQGAWKAGIEGLSAAWKAFAAYVVDVMAKVAKSVVAIWSKAVGGLAKGMLTVASKDNLAGKIMSKILGVDVRAEMEKAKKLNAQLGISGDPLQDAFRSVDQQMDGMKDQADSYLDDMVLSFEEAAAEASKAAAAAAGPGSEALREALEAEAARFDELTAKAKAAGDKRRAELAAAAGIPDGEGGGAALAATTTAGSFSGAALGLLGGGGPVERMADDIRAARKLQERAEVHLDIIARKGGPRFA